MAETARPKAQRAGIILRLLAGGYDLVILFSVGMVAVGIPITISYEVFDAAPPTWIQFLLSMSVAYGYFVGFWFKAGATTGMRPWKLRVAMVNSGDSVTLTAATVRFFALMVTWLALTMTLLYLFGHYTGHPLFIIAAGLPAVSLACMMLTPNRQALHDLVSGTAVYHIEG